MDTMVDFGLLLLDFLYAYLLYIKINGTEMTALAKAFSDASGIRANGLHVGGVKYIALRADDRSVYGKKVSICY
jgi:profilin